VVHTALDPSRQSYQLQREGSLTFKGPNILTAAARHQPPQTARANTVAETGPQIVSQSRRQQRQLTVTIQLTNPSRLSKPSARRKARSAAAWTASSMVDGGARLALRIAATRPPPPATYRPRSETKLGLEQETAIRRSRWELRATTDLIDGGTIRFQRKARAP
jgi:hypothetical protein